MTEADQTQPSPPDPQSDEPVGVPPGEPGPREVAEQLLAAGGGVLVTGTTLLERHLVRTEQDLPDVVTALVGLRLPRRDGTTDERLSALAPLAVMRTVTHLDLAGTAVTDGGLASLSDWNSLQKIDLSDTEVSAEGLVHLRGLPDLSALELAGTDLAELTFEEAMGSREVDPNVRHTLEAAQRGLARAVDWSLVTAAASTALEGRGGLREALTQDVLIEQAGLDPTLAGWIALPLAGLATVLGLVILEFIALPVFGMTPARALLRLRVVGEEGTRPGPLRAALRAFGAAAAGLGMGVIPLPWLLGPWQALGLARGQRAPWDRWARTRVQARPCPAWRVALAIAAPAAWLILR